VTERLYETVARRMKDTSRKEVRTPRERQSGHLKRGVKMNRLNYVALARRTTVQGVASDVSDQLLGEPLTGSLNDQGAVAEMIDR
jgi:hypothetical protein